MLNRCVEFQDSGGRGKFKFQEARATEASFDNWGIIN